MLQWNVKKIRQLNLATHRDLGYFFSFLILIYCISGIALNHADDWNPDFILKKVTVHFKRSYTKVEIGEKQVRYFGKLVGEEQHKVYDFPTNDQVKIYYNNASLHVYLDQKKAIYEQVAKRPMFYQTNVIHRNSLNGWKWASDIFAILLITVTVTGIFIAKGKYGISRRGKWLIAAGTLPPIAAIVIQALV